MKDRFVALIIFGVLALIAFGIYELMNWYDNLPDVKSRLASYEEQSNWEVKAEKIAHDTNDTSTLKSIYLEAIKRGADPSWANAWDCCDNITEVYKYAHAKYEVLIQK